MKKRGILISFEGAEGVGKSTQLALLEKRLRNENFPVYRTREPGGTALGEELRRLLKTYEMNALTELFIVEASRSDHVSLEIKPRLERGEIVLCDRYAESSLVYQGMLGKLPLKLVQNLNKLATQAIQADLCIWLDIHPKYIPERLRARSSGPDRFDGQSEDFHKKIVMSYRRLSKILKKPKLHRFDASQSPESLHEEIFHAVKNLIQKKAIRKC